jgi:hypothetical protein
MRSRIYQPVAMILFGGNPAVANDGGMRRGRSPMLEPTKTSTPAAILTPSIQIILSRVAVGDAAHANFACLIFCSLAPTPVNSGERRGAE